MAARLLDGKTVAADIRRELTLQVRDWPMPMPPGLALLLVGDDAASSVYVRNKILACKDVGVHSVCIRLPATAGEGQILEQVERLNNDASIHGVLVQLPLPRGIDATRVIAAISPLKDVDGVGLERQGALVAGLPGLRPCTAAGVMELLRRAAVPLRGARAVVLGRSNIVGKPLSLLLLQADATVTICHSCTTDLADVTRQADILVAAIGRPRFIKAHMIKPGAVVIDVGINRDAVPGGSGQLCGDVDFDAVSQVAGLLTPVPGGVGPMTIAMLIKNTVAAALRSQVTPCGRPSDRAS